MSSNRLNTTIKPLPFKGLKAYASARGGSCRHSVQALAQVIRKEGAWPLQRREPENRQQMRFHIFTVYCIPRGVLDSVFPGGFNLNRSWAFCCTLVLDVCRRAPWTRQWSSTGVIRGRGAKLPLNPNFDVDLKPRDIDRPLIHCKSELENGFDRSPDRDLHSRLRACGRHSAFLHRCRSIDEIPQLGLIQRLELKAAAVSPFPEWTLGGLRQSELPDSSAP